MSDLHIPEAAQEEYFTCGCHDPRCTRVGYQPGALPLVVAAELRQLADEIDRGCEDYVKDGASELIRAKCIEDIAVAGKLRSRADNLDGGAS